MSGDAKPYRFAWKDLGDIEVGRPNLGNIMNVSIYRLMQYTLRDVLDRRYSPETAAGILREAGYVAGREFCRNMLDCSLPFEGFVSLLQEKLQALGIGILRMEETDAENMVFVMTLAEDLDCSGLPVSGVTVCEYDEGFIAGLLELYTGKEFNVREIDCWSTGERTCRFRAVAQDWEQV